MRSRTWIVAVAVAGLLSAGAAAPAYAAVESASPATSSAPSAEQHGKIGQDGMPEPGRMHKQMMKGMPDMASMGRMHKQMMKGMRDMASMDQDMMQSMPGMAKMHEQMMTSHPADGMPSAQARGNQGE